MFEPGLCYVEWCFALLYPKLPVQCILAQQLSHAGVHGQVTELTKVSQKKYAMAVTVALGKEMDSVVVDNDKTGKECIRYLTEQRIQPLTFIPLSSVKAQPTNDRLRQLGGSAKLVIDLLQYEPHLDRAFRYVCG